MIFKDNHGKNVFQVNVDSSGHEIYDFNSNALIEFGWNFLTITSSEQSLIKAKGLLINGYSI